MLEKFPYLQNKCEHVPLKACDSSLPQPKQLRFRLKASNVIVTDSSFNESILPMQSRPKINSPISDQKQIRVQIPLQSSNLR